MATDALKSTAITNLDATPPFRSTAGEGATGEMRENGAVLVTTAGAAVGSTYKFLRLPTNAKVKHLFIENGNASGGSYNAGIYYSDSTTDGTSPGNQGAALATTLFASAYSLAAVIGEPTDIVNASGSYGMAERLVPLWSACGLTADPGGAFDIVLTSTVTPLAATTISLSAQFVL